jgi:hypothetical protein
MYFNPDPHGFYQCVSMYTNTKDNEQELLIYSKTSPQVCFAVGNLCDACHYIEHVLSFLKNDKVQQRVIFTILKRKLKSLVHEYLQYPYQNRGRSQPDIHVPYVEHVLSFLKSLITCNFLKY